MTQRKPTVDLAFPTEAHGRIPSVADIAEEAACWDTHDVTDFMAESGPVHVTVSHELTGRLTFPPDQTDR